MASYALLDEINVPSDLRNLKENDLPLLARELREELINIVSKTGGHLGAGLGVIELTIALHYIFETPDDRIIWDVGHQSYPHKILTGRRKLMKTLRKGGVYLDLQKDLKVFTIHLGQRTRLPRYHQVWV